MPPQERVLDLIGRIYAAAADTTLWPAFFEDFANGVDASTTAIVSHDLSTGRGSPLANIRIDLASIRLDPHYAQRWVEYYSTVDEWFKVWKKRLNQDDPQSVATSEELMEFGQLERTEFFNDYLLPQDTIHQLGGVVLKEEHQVIGFLTCLRSRKKGPFGPAEVKLLSALIPHLQRAMQFQRATAELQGKYRASLDAMDRLPVGIMLFDDTGCLLKLNRSAKRVMDQNDGLAVAQDGFRAADSHENKSLRLLMASAALPATQNGRPSGGPLAISRPSGKRPYALLAMPSSCGSFAFEVKRCAVIVFISDPEDTPRTPVQSFSSLYHLTAAEIIDLKKNGVSEHIIEFMVNTPSS